MGEPLDNQPGEPGPESVQFEQKVITDPKERMDLIANTLETSVKASIGSVAGMLDLAIRRGNPDFTQMAKQDADQGNDDLDAILRVMRMNPNKPLPVDRKTHASSGISVIVLNAVPKPKSGVTFRFGDPPSNK